MERFQSRSIFHLEVSMRKNSQGRCAGERPSRCQARGISGKVPKRKITKGNALNANRNQFLFVFRFFQLQLWMAFILTVVTSCGGTPENAGPQYGKKPASNGVPVYSFVVHPLYNPTKLFEAYQPLIDY